MQSAHSERQGARKRPVSLKINLAISAIFLMIVALLTAYSYIADRNNNLELAIVQVRGMNAFYFDSLNTLMLADAIDERATLRDKMLEMPGVIEVRMNRGESINAKYGDGLPGEQAVDELDRRGLAGESVVEISESEGRRLLTLVEPYALTRDTRGTDCLECHRRVEPGTIGGAVRLTYSLQELDALALAALWEKLAVITVLFVAGLLLLSLILRRVIVRPVRDMVERIRDIAAGEGDLTQSLDERANDELGELAHWFNIFVGNLRDMVEGIRRQVADLAGASDHLQRSAQQSNESVLQQRADTDHVAAAMTEMSATVDEVARNADAAAAAAARSRDEVRQGRETMDATIEAINQLAEQVETAGGVIARLDQESDAISVVLEVIRSIAEQTNLLALNAAIESARAGEHGRGFAVVADEVRTLAERTHRSTQEIQGMIESLQMGAKGAVQAMQTGRQQAGSSVEQVAKAGASLDLVSAAVDTISSMSQQIALAAEEHSTASSEINHSLVNINQGVAATAADTEQVATASRQLGAVAEHLQALVQQFRTS